MELVELVLNHFTRRLRHNESFKPLPELVRIAFAVVFRNTELLLNSLQLLTQEKFSLLIIYLILDLLRNLGLKSCEFELMTHEQQYALHAVEDRNRLEDPLELHRVGACNRRCKVRERRWFIRREIIEVVLQLL